MRGQRLLGHRRPLLSLSTSTPPFPSRAIPQQQQQRIVTPLQPSSPTSFISVSQPRHFTTTPPKPSPNNPSKMSAAAPRPGSPNRALLESEVKRNPHPDFKTVESSRPPWDASSVLTYTQTASPSWTFGDGANGTDPAAETTPHISIDPYAAGRPATFNYKLLISAIIPRPIAFLSTRSADGTSTNLAPFSYFQLISHDPPLFIIGFVGTLPAGGRCKDSLRNLHETGECVINIIGEGFVEAANSTSIDAPYGLSEWDVSGLTPKYDCETVKCARVGEAVFSIEGKLESVREFESRVVKGRVTSTLAVVEGTRFWAREDAINEERSLVDTKVLRPIARLGGITYARMTEAVEIPRPDFKKDLGEEGAAKLKSKQQLPN
ncbi:hypothetical protein B0T19DRAFT_415957 [Cercophora scortea]|uniref:Flavin reductase like domain-containing protein n=1 Tax=Cercophora scortea TaxID=314031 RepID=A0AAE0MH90_9PEZI|nr:hypothetical protein B0T19DRAFT_415957 [Cercophora scortea]